MISLIFYILLCVPKIVLSIESLEVITTLGPVRGKLINDGITGAVYYSFEGIPYAEPPVENLRFKPPVQKQAWCSVRDATKPGSVCPQMELFYSREQMNEDCLNFNVYTPANYLNKSLPVFFYIHDGDFKLQSGNAEPIYGPQFLIMKDMVVVTVNYRLGALGFLSFGTEEVSGNAGIKDVILALKIIHKNIQRFGGDPNKICMVGNGAGAAIAELLMLTNQTNGLFQSAILHSGSVLSAKFVEVSPKQNAILLSKELGLDVKKYDFMLEKLRHINAFEIVNAQDAIEQRDPKRGFRMFSMFKPTVEIQCKDAIITRPPLEMIRDGAILDIPILIGLNNEEGLEMFPLLKRDPKLIDRLNENFELFIPADIQYPYGSAARRNLAAQIREFYFDGGNISFVNIQNYVNLISDTQYTYGIDLFVKLFKEQKCSPVYYYVHGGDAELNWFKKIEHITYPGSAHSDNFGYVFLTSATKSLYQCLDSNTKKVQDVTLSSGQSFLYYGSPVFTNAIHLWPEAGIERSHLEVGYHTRAVLHRPFAKRIDFWSKVYEEYFNCT